MDSEKPIEDLLLALNERAKELNCLYEIEELFSMPELTLEDILKGIVRAIPAGWQYPDVCAAKIILESLVVQSPHWKESEWIQTAPLLVQEEMVGEISVVYTEQMPDADEGPFLKEERKLINTIADRLVRRIFHERMKAVFEDRTNVPEQGGQSFAILNLLKNTDSKLLSRISRRMLNLLLWAGIEEANRFQVVQQADSWRFEENQPAKKNQNIDLLNEADEIFQLAQKFLGEKQMLDNIQEWIVEDRSNAIMKILEDPRTSLADIINAIERFHHRSPRVLQLSPPREKAFRVALIRRLLNDNPDFIQIAKRCLDVSDFYDLWSHIIFQAGSHGRIGGKGSGLFLGKQILARSLQGDDAVRKIKTPKTWYITSDGILNFIRFNDLEEMMEMKYEDIAQVRQEYPYLVHIFKNSLLQPEIMNGLSHALDDFGEKPIVVRSSSLLEDQLRSSFAGKYKSLFLANQGPKQKRLNALADAITEVYASTFNPDAIQYRAEHGMIDSHEEMGILIQEVVGRKVGDYFLPAFSGVGFSRNEFRWSPRIQREDGLVRMVPGLGTRAVDRTSDDYPILISPGQPNLRVNVTLEEKIWYSPKKADALNLKTGNFETIDFRNLLKSNGNEYPMISNLISIIERGRLRTPADATDVGDNNVVITFDGLIQNTDFLDQIRSVLRVLQTEMNGPVDIEFAHDGTDLYLLQCRSQSHSDRYQAPLIPKKIPAEKIVFTANRYVTSGMVSGITHIVFIDPVKYGELQNRQDFIDVGTAVGKLNRLLPKRNFILMGPGRWGSRGDIKLGVTVGYSDINNTAMLIEIARKQKGFVPELSFGTHFFQDLIESSILYLPLYPDERSNIMNENILFHPSNMFADLLPEHKQLQEVIRVIEIGKIVPRHVLQVLMDGDRNEAVAILTDQPAYVPELIPAETMPPPQSKNDNIHWRWRMRRVEQLAAQLDPVRFGVKAAYLFGSTNTAMSGPQSDIDLLIHIQATESQKRELTAWLEGWSLSLSEENYLRTGFKTSGLLDVHLVTDQDIKNRTSYAIKIGSTIDPLRPLPLGTSIKKA